MWCLPTESLPTTSTVTGHIRTTSSGYADPTIVVGAKDGSAMLARTCSLVLQIGIPFQSEFDGSFRELQTKSSASSSPQRSFGPLRCCSAAVSECRERHWNTRQFRVAPPVTQNCWEVWTCCIRICRRAKSGLSSGVLWERGQPFSKLLSVHPFLAVASSSPFGRPRWQWRRRARTDSLMNSSFWSAQGVTVRNCDGVAAASSFRPETGYARNTVRNSTTKRRRTNLTSR